MIKPIKIINSVIDATPQIAKKAENIATKASEETKDLVRAESELLQSYHGVKPKKLFASFSDFISDFSAKLETYRNDIPENLFKQIEEAKNNNNFSLNKIIQNYYSKLNDCKTLDDVRKAYPEIKLPDKSPQDIVKDELKSSISQQACENLKKLGTKEQQDQYFKTIVNSIVSIPKQKDKAVFGEISKLADEIKEEILKGTFKGNPNTESCSCINSVRVRIIDMLLTEPDYQKTIIDILKQNYIEGKSPTNIIIKGQHFDIRAIVLKKSYPFSTFDNNFRTFLKNAENTAGQFKDLEKLNRTEIKSAILTQTWKKSKLRAALANETSYGKDWSLIPTVWRKTMFPNETHHPTEKLIDTYLLSLFKAGNTEVTATNPLLKHVQEPQLSKTKIKLLKRLYHNSKLLEDEKRLLNSPQYKEFKAKFDIEGMKKSIESIEEHYKNVFFKHFWTPERIEAFQKALNENIELANKNIEISDSILIDAMDRVFKAEK